MKVLYFVNGVPTPAQFAEADKLEGTVEFRDINLFDPEAEIEKFDKVYGEVPSNYLEAAGAVPTEDKKAFPDAVVLDIPGKKAK